MKRVVLGLIVGTLGGLPAHAGVPEDAGRYCAKAYADRMVDSEHYNRNMTLCIQTYLKRERYDALKGIGEQ